MGSLITTILRRSRQSDQTNVLGRPTLLRARGGAWRAGFIRLHTAVEPDLTTLNHGKLCVGKALSILEREGIAAKGASVWGNDLLSVLSDPLPVGTFTFLCAMGMSCLGWMVGYLGSNHECKRSGSRLRCCGVSWQRTGHQSERR